MRDDFKCDLVFRSVKPFLESALGGHPANGAHERLGDGDIFLNFLRGRRLSLLFRFQCLLGDEHQQHHFFKSGFYAEPLLCAGTKQKKRRHRECKDSNRPDYRGREQRANDNRNCIFKNIHSYVLTTTPYGPFFCNQSFNSKIRSVFNFVS